MSCYANEEKKVAMILLGRRAWGLLGITFVLIGPAALVAAAPRAAAATGGEQTVIDFGQIRPEAIKTRDTQIAPAAGRSDLRLRIMAGHKQEWPAVLMHPPQDVWNLQQRQYVAVDVKNAGGEPVSAGLRIDSAGADRRKPGPQARVDLQPGQRRTIVVPLGQRMPEGLKGKLFAMQAFPFGWKEGGQFDPSRVSEISIYVARPTADHVLEVSNIRAGGTAVPTGAATVEHLFPLIDKYGQFMHGQWPGKVLSDADLARRRTEEAADLARHPGPAGWDQYGGWQAGPRLNATGYFRVEKRRGRWWLVDPDGRLFWSHGVDSVRANTGGSPVTRREAWFAELPQPGSPLARFYQPMTVGPTGYYQGQKIQLFNFQAANLMRKYGADWQQQFALLAHQRLRSWGLNTAGDWSESKFYLLHKTPYCVDIRHSSPRIEGSTGYWGKFYDVFDPQFAGELRRAMAKEKGVSAGDPWCIGYFPDNELGWGDELSLALAALASPAGQPAKRVLVDDLKAKYGTIAALNAAWGSQHGSWDDLLASKTPPDKVRARPDLTAFTTKLAETYFRTCRDAVHEVAPQQLYLGCRFAGSWTNDLAVRAAAKYCDVVSVNRYQDTADDFRLPEGIDVPVVVGEFHFGALDRGLFHGGLRPVANQQERAEAYQRYVRGALVNPWLVGAHWFEFADEPTAGRWDGENYQIGLVDVCDTPYAETIEASRRLGAELYLIRNEMGKGR